MQLEACLLLKVADHTEQISRLRIAARSEHADQTFGLRAGFGTEPFKADCRLDVVAQNGFAGIDVASEHGVDAFAQERAAEFRIACDTLARQLSKALRYRRFLAVWT
jgi:hypothetical protein